MAPPQAAAKQVMHDSRNRCMRHDRTLPEARPDLGVLEGAPYGQCVAVRASVSKKKFV